MGKIRKQPKRTTKRQKALSFRNPFISETPLVPAQMIQNLKKSEKIMILQLEEMVTEPDESPQKNILIMKQALEQQEARINELSSLSSRIKNIQLQKELNVPSKEVEHDEQKSSHPLLDSCVGLNHVDWMLHQNQSISFF